MVTIYAPLTLLLQRFSEVPDSEITDILAIPKLKICIKKAQSNGFSGIADKLDIPNCTGTSENLCVSSKVQ